MKKSILFILFLTFLSSTLYALPSHIDDAYHSHYQIELGNLLRKQRPFLYSYTNTNNALFFRDYFFTLSKKINICQFNQRDKKRQRCLKHYYFNFNERAFEQKLIDKVTYKLLKVAINKFSIKGKALQIKGNKKIHPYQLVSFWINKNMLLKRYRKNTGNDGYDEEILELMNRYYKRRIRGIGKVKVENYIPFTFTTAQLFFMERLLKDTVNMMNSSRGKVILTLMEDNEENDYYDNQSELLEYVNMIRLTRESDEIQKLDKKIMTVSKNMVELRGKSELIDLKLKLRSLEDEKQQLINTILKTTQANERFSIYNSIQKIFSDIVQLERRATKYSRSFELGLREVRMFTLKHLKIELTKATLSGSLKGRSANFGDLISASYLSGEEDETVLRTLLSMKEMQEGWVPGYKKAGAYVLRATKTLLILNPITSPYASLAFVIYDSIKSAKEYEKERVNEAYHF